MIISLLMGIIIISLIVWSIIRKINNDDNEVEFEYYINNNGRDPIDMPRTFISNWKYNILENHLYILYLPLESPTLEYLRYIWEGYNGREIYLDVYEKGEIVGRYKIRDGKVCLRRK